MYQIALLMCFLHYKMRELPKAPFLYVIDNLSNTFVPFMIKVFNISINFVFKHRKLHFFELHLIKLDGRNKELKKRKVPLIDS